MISLFIATLWCICIQLSILPLSDYLCVPLEQRHGQPSWATWSAGRCEQMYILCFIVSTLLHLPTLNTLFLRTQNSVFCSFTALWDICNDWRPVSSIFFSSRLAHLPVCYVFDEYLSLVAFKTSVQPLLWFTACTLTSFLGFWWISFSGNVQDQCPASSLVHGLHTFQCVRFLMSIFLW